MKKYSCHFFAVVKYMYSLCSHKYHFHMCAELISDIVFQLIFVVYKHDNPNHNAMFLS